MALYGFDVKTISRLRGESVAKTASYILRENIFDPYSGETHYYSHVRDCLYREILLPENAPREFLDLSKLLAAIERAEKRYDARTGRVVRLTLPNDKEFSDGERVALAREYVQGTFLTQGMCAIMAIHAGLNEDPAKNNPHAHVILTDRPVDANGFCSKKNRSWNKIEQLQKWRKLWAEVQNRTFKEKGLDVRVSHESLKSKTLTGSQQFPLAVQPQLLSAKGCKQNMATEIEKLQLNKESRRKNGGAGGSSIAPANAPAKCPK